MKSILVITQKVDQEDDLLGFFVAWLREFARSFDRVFVIALAKGKYDLPSNVVINSLGKEKNAPKFIQAFRFYKLLFQLVPQADSIFAHMSPIFAIAAWPITFIYGRKIVLWYLHRSVTPRLQFAEKLCASIVTADKDSLQLKSRKVVEVGHGIEVEKFRGEHDWNRTNPLRIISVGRISPIKNYETLIQAAYLLREKNFNFKVQIVGRPVIAGDLAYEQDLKKCITDLNLGDQIIFKGFVPHTQMPALYKEADMVVNLTPTGGIDKTNLEAMASGCITLTSNQVFRKYFGQYASQLIFEHNNAQDLADKIFDLARQTSEKKKNISDFLVNIAQSYSIPKVIAKISALL